MLDFFQELLIHAEKYHPITKGNDIWIKCPFHSGGHERTASCRINLQKGKYPIGYWYCFGCGKYGNWNDLALTLGLKQLSDQEIKDQDLLLTTLTPSQKDSLLGNEIKNQINFDLMAKWDKNKIWRNINGELLNKIGSYEFLNRKNELQLFLPCYQNYELKGGIFCYFEKKPNRPTYINTSGPWVKKSLFPFDYTRKLLKENNFLALVEGPRDALNLLQYGFPALAILGSKNWSSLKENLIKSLGLDKIILAFDNDLAGNQATEIVGNSFKDMDNIFQMSFKENQDPGDLTEKEICKFLNIFKGK